MNPYGEGKSFRDWLKAHPEYRALLDQQARFMAEDIWDVIGPRKVIEAEYEVIDDKVASPVPPRHPLHLCPPRPDGDNRGDRGG